MKNSSLIILMLLVFQISGQTNLSAKDAVFRALVNNYQVQISHLQVDIATKQNSWGEAGLFPTVTLGAGFGASLQDNSKNPFTFIPGIISNTSINPNLSANWNLFSGFRVRISKERLGILEDQSKGNSLVLIENTTQDVVKAYYSAQLQKERMLLFQKTMKISAQRNRLYELKEKYASSSSLELLQFKNQYLTDSTNYLLQEISYNNSLRNLLILMNDSTLQVDALSLSDSLSFDFPLLDREQVLQQLLSSNQNLKNQYLSLELQQKQTELAKSFLYPTITFTGSVAPSYAWLRNLNDPTFKKHTEVLNYSGTINVRYTLFDNWKNMRAVEVSKIQTEISLLNQKSLEQRLVTTMENLLEVYQLRSNLLTISEENLTYATKAWELAQRRFEMGSINSVDLTTFQRNFETTLIQHYENQYNKLETYLEIYKMIGNLGLDFME